MILISISYILLFCGFIFKASEVYHSSAHLVTVDDCGRTSMAIGRIVGGTYTKIGGHPWMALLEVELITDSGFQTLCGASVLNENWIITAAHCLELGKPLKDVDLRVLVGLHKLSKRNASTVQEIKISKIIAHKNYSGVTEENDIALLKTVEPIDIKGSWGYVNGICLPNYDADPTGEVTVTGWGYEYQDGSMSNILKEVIIPVVPRDVCNRNWSYASNPSDDTVEVTESKFCAGMPYKDSCQMDSGGPVFQKDSEGTATLVGIVSYGLGCGDMSYPGVNTKVSYFLDWIKNVVNSE